MATTGWARRPRPSHSAQAPSTANPTRDPPTSTIQNPADVFLPRNVVTEVYPGLYNSIVGDKGARAHFNPGLYVIKGAFDLTDGHTYTGSGVTFYLALKRAGIHSDLHVYSSGGHGFGVRPTNATCSAWTTACTDWLRNQGFLKPNSGE